MVVYSGMKMCFDDPVTKVSAEPLHPVGTQRFELDDNGNLKKYTYQQADDAVDINTSVKLDAAASTDGKKITPQAAAGDSFFGVAEVAFPDEYYGWITTGGIASCGVANGVAVDDPLGASSTAGILADVGEAGSGDYKFVAAIAMEANSSGSGAVKKVYIPF